MADEPVSFTPGPLTAKGGTIYSASDEVLGWADCSLAAHDGGANDEANARLWSAAPDMYAALKEVRSWQSLDFMPPEIRGAWLRAEAALSKATGAA